MGACDTGRCCKGSLCENSKKCCCTAAHGIFHAGEVCRTAACTNGGSCDYMSACECEASGGTLGQSCDPCVNVVCDKCEQCVDGTCRSTCSGCQTCDTSSINGTCVDRPCSPACGQCQTCACVNNSKICIATGVPCGGTCCSFSQCCVNGACVDCDCAGQQKPIGCYICQGGQWVYECSLGKVCCGGACKQCCVTADCAGFGAGYICDNGTCRPQSCSDYEAGFTYNCYSPFETACGTTGKNGDYAYSHPCPAGCVIDSTGYSPAPLGGTGTAAACCQTYYVGRCVGNLLP